MNNRLKGEKTMDSLTKTIRIRLLLAVSSMFAFTAYGADDIFSAQYARTAVEQYHAYVAKNCGPLSPRWSPDYNHHFQWCLQADAATAEAEQLARARALEACGVDSKTDIVMEVEVRLDTIHIIDEADGGNSNAEPYLWPVFCKVDSDTLQYIEMLKTDPHRANLSSWVHGPGGSHENLGTNGGDGWDAGEVIHIPQHLGVWRTTLRPNNIADHQTGVFAVAVLLEEDTAPTDSAIDDEYAKFVNKAASLLSASLSKLGPDAWLLAGNTNLLKKTSEDAQQEMKFRLSKENAYANKLSDEPWLTTVFPGLLELLVGVIDIDDFIGIEIKYWNWQELASGSASPLVAQWNKSTGSEDGDFTLRGSARGAVVSYAKAP